MLTTTTNTIECLFNLEQIILTTGYENQSSYHMIKFPSVLLGRVQIHKITQISDSKHITLMLLNNYIQVSNVIYTDL